MPGNFEVSSYAKDRTSVGLSFLRHCLFKARIWASPIRTNITSLLRAEGCFLAILGKREEKMRLSTLVRVSFV